MKYPLRSFLVVSVLVAPISVHSYPGTLEISEARPSALVRTKPQAPSIRKTPLKTPGRSPRFFLRSLSAWNRVLIPLAFFGAVKEQNSELHKAKRAARSSATWAALLDSRDGSLGLSRAVGEALVLSAPDGPNNKDNFVSVGDPEAVPPAFSLGASFGESEEGQELRAVRNTIDRQVEDWNRGDLTDFLRHYDASPDTFIFVFGSRIYTGIAEYRAHMREAYPEPKHMGKLWITDVRVQKGEPGPREYVANFHVHHQVGDEVNRCNVELWLQEIDGRLRITFENVTPMHLGSIYAGIHNAFESLRHPNVVAERRALHAIVRSHPALSPIAREFDGFLRHVETNRHAFLQSSLERNSFWDLLRMGRTSLARHVEETAALLNEVERLMPQFTLAPVPDTLRRLRNFVSSMSLALNLESRITTDPGPMATRTFTLRYATVDEVARGMAQGGLVSNGNSPIQLQRANPATMVRPVEAGPMAGTIRLLLRPGVPTPSLQRGSTIEVLEYDLRLAVSAHQWDGNQWLELDLPLSFSHAPLRRSGPLRAD